MAQLEIRLFGEPSIRLGDRQLNHLVGQKPGDLLCILLLNRPRIVPRETLANRLWPDSDLARPNVRTALWRLRAALDPASADGGRFIVASPQGIGFDRASDHWLDVAEFEALLRPMAAGEESREARAARLRQACDLYRGDLLESCYDDWCVEERERLQKRYLAALGELLDYHAARDEYDEAIGYGRLIIRRDRTQEATHREIMRLHYLAGRRDIALQQYVLCREILLRDLGIEPMAATNQLRERIRQELPLADERPGSPRVLQRLPPAKDENDDPMACLEAALARLEAAVSGVREALAALRAGHGDGPGEAAVQRARVTARRNGDGHPRQRAI